MMEQDTEFAFTASTIQLGTAEYVYRSIRKIKDEFHAADIAFREQHGFGLNDKVVVCATADQRRAIEESLQNSEAVGTTAIDAGIRFSQFDLPFPLRDKDGNECVAVVKDVGMWPISSIGFVDIEDAGK